MLEPMTGSNAIVAGCRLSPAQLLGAPVRDASGTVVGVVTGVYVDADTDRPAWVVVATDPPGKPEPLVPLARATHDPHEGLAVPLPAAVLRSAPALAGPAAELDLAHEDELYHYYARAFSPTGRPAQYVQPAKPTGRTRLRRYPARPT
jgi:hypothetical protein